ncbi:MAG: SPASM domain-containing protein [Schwartzia sp.]|nr:SPASM domain-containing protein [Schwartzia sp. (in: firmicutes)]
MNRVAFEESAKFIHEYKSKNGMKLRVSSCFSQLRAYLGGEDPRHNGNRGITCGCEAGRSFCTVNADGKLLPCLKLASVEKGRLNDYWKNSSALKELRSEENKPYCAECVYVRRCRPCVAPEWKIENCTLRG